MWVEFNLLLVLYSPPRGFSPGTPVFPTPQKPTFPNSNSILECTNISERVLVNSLVLRRWINKLHFIFNPKTRLALICFTEGQLSCFWMESESRISFAGLKYYLWGHLFIAFVLLHIDFLVNWYIIVFFWGHTLTFTLLSEICTIKAVRSVSKQGQLQPRCYSEARSLSWQL